jgi:hypothetical protein
MPAYTGAFSHLLAPGLRKVWLDELKQWPEEYSKLLNIQTSKRAYEEELMMAGLGRWDEKPEGHATVYDDPIMGNKKRFTHASFSLGFRVSREMWSDDLYGVMKKMSGQLAMAGKQTVEVEASNVFNEAFSTTRPNLLGADGLALCSTAHPLIIGGTYANRPAADVDFGITPLRAMLENREALVDERGLPAMLGSKTVLIGPANQWAAKEILRSQQAAYTTDNEINAFRDLELEFFVYHYGDDADAWFLLAPKGKHGLNFIWREKPTFENSDDFDTGDAKFKGFMRFSYGHTDWRGVDGSSGG